MSATIKDLANEVGVSESTVSRALNDYDDVNEKTRRKIVKVAERLNYKPNAIARGLARKKTNTIGLFLLGKIGEGHPFAMKLVAGVMNASRKSEYDILLFSETEVRSDSYIQRCQERSVDGAIILGIKSNDPHLEEIKNSDIPIILIDIPVSGKKTTYVSSHNVEGAYQAVKYLMNLGHQKVVFMNGHEHAPVSKERLQGYKLAHQDCKIKYNDQLVLNGKYERDIAYQRMKKFLSLNKDFTAVFAASDLMALGVMDALKEVNIKIPEEVSIIGFDDIELCTHTNPQLSTVKQKRFEMGQRAVIGLLEMIEEGSNSVEPVLLDYELVIRGSVQSN
ncbi:transcriptional regulator [Halobacteroides halobius DSM 5150]|uniref:Transcriptional regulator n=1 Tax=Halobacteroides halobius (strain ATCC 35273 / DSM 5150 / MD-1) TaxID=748449 RepID=L0KB36_HALHC|nr:LacI family DNA-binding transcriptional regulator [Halobacteroides halobius]AGB41750.1 transcriptional regulator [Halobacteroides halobius DSM 5150]